MIPHLVERKERRRKEKKERKKILTKEMEMINPYSELHLVKNRESTL